jgi:hypothetical protein
MVKDMLRRSHVRPAACIVGLALLFGAPPALADKGSGKDGSDDDGRREAEVTGRCSKGATSDMRLRSRDGAIRLEFEVRRRRSGEAWRVVIVQERRVVWRATLRTRRSSGTIRVRQTLEDLQGPDQISARASGPGGLSCEAVATLPA